MDLHVKKPITATWEATRKCNMHCLHCYNESNLEGKELPFLKCIEILNKLADFGITTLMISGGEPLMRKDILEISKHARHRFEELILQTNGSLVPYINEEILKQYDEITISVYGLGYTDIVYKQYPKPNIQEAIQRLRKLHVPVTLTTVLTALNKNEIEKLYNYAKRENANSFIVQELVPIGRAAQNPQLNLAEEEKSDIIDMLKRHDEFVSDKFVRFGRLQPCGGGTLFIEVDYVGNVSPCAFIPYGENLFEKSLEEIICHSTLFNGFRKFKMGKRYCPLLVDSPRNSYKELEAYIG